MNTISNLVIAFVGLFFISKTKTKAGELASSILDASGNIIDYATQVIKDATNTTATPAKSKSSAK